MIIFSDIFKSVPITCKVCNGEKRVLLAGNTRRTKCNGCHGKGLQYEQVPVEPIAKDAHRLIIELSDGQKFYGYERKIYDGTIVFELSVMAGTLAVLPRAANSAYLFDVEKTRRKVVGHGN